MSSSPRRRSGRPPRRRGSSCGSRTPRKDRPLQHAGTLAGILVAVVAALNWGGREGVIGVTLWALGGAWLVASYRRLLPPALVGMAIGAGLAVLAITVRLLRHSGGGSSPTSIDRRSQTHHAL